MAPIVTNGASFIYPTIDDVPANGDDSYYLNNPAPYDVEIPDQLFGSKRKLKVIVLGSGMSGINFFKYAEDKATDLDIVCYEKNEDIGGTWLENRYPGCACDIPSVVYQFPWRPAPWSKYYSHSPEIWKYVKMVCEENGFIRKYIRLSHEALKLDWNGKTGQWTVTVKDLKSGRTFEDTSDFVVNATGVLNKWKWPDIPGLNDFKGTLLHSAQWNQGVDLKDKRVALVGAGSSAVQILPNIYDDVSQVYTWQKLFENPDEYKAYCKMIEGELNQRFPFIINGSRAQRDAVDYSINEMKSKLSKRPELLEKVMPKDFFVGCRRPTPGNGYLEALTDSKTTAYPSQLGRITANGFIDPDGKEQQVDLIICATGFDTSYKPRMPIVVDGVNKNDEWAHNDPVAPAPTYLSVALDGVPNYIVFAGAYCPAAHGSFFPLIQCYSEYTLQILEKMQMENIKSIQVKRRALEQFLRHSDTFLKRTSWTGPSPGSKAGNQMGNPRYGPAPACPS
ncbi:hypothetical protein LTR66_017457 [Elasticomyces elasticus]|nr:hypothetical protein LTR66_017457 [Elasticomyces elasticus]